MYVITVGCTPIKKKKKEAIQPVLLYSYHPRKKRVLSIIIAEKGPKRGRKAIIAKIVSHDETPIKQLCSESVKQTKNIYNLS